MDLISGLLAIFAFCVVCVAGMAVGAPLERILVKSILALAAFAFLGRIWSWLGRNLVMEGVDTTYSPEQKGQEDAPHRPVPGGARRPPPEETLAGPPGEGGR